MPGLVNPASAMKEALRRLLVDDSTRTVNAAPEAFPTSARHHSSRRGSLSASGTSGDPRSRRRTGSRISQTQQDRSEGSRSGRRQHRRGDGFEAAPPPEALPSVDFYEHFPAYVGATANVLVSSPTECEVLRLAGAAVEVVEDEEARDVSQRRLSKADVQSGGFLLYQADTAEAPQYFLLDTTEEQVYGSATYLPSPHKPQAEMLRLSTSSSSRGIC